MTDVLIDTDTCPLCGKKIIPALYALHRTRCSFACGICGWTMQGWRLSASNMAGHANGVGHLGALAFRDVPNALAPSSEALEVAQEAQRAVGSVLSKGGIRFTWPNVLLDGRPEASGWALVQPAYLAPFFKSAAAVIERGMYRSAVYREIRQEVQGCIRLGRLTPQAEALIIQWDAWSRA